MTPSLRGTLRVSVGSFAVLLLATAAALAIVTTCLHRVVVRLGASVDSVRAAEQLQVDLLTHHGIVTRLAMRGDTEGVFAPWAFERRVHRLLDTSVREAHDGVELALIASAGTAVDAYLAAHRAQTASGVIDLPALEPPFGAAVTAVDALTSRVVDEARAARAQATHWDSLANVLAVVAAVLAIAGVTTLLIAARRLVGRPLAELHGAVVAFAAGDKGARAKPSGARELRDLTVRFDEMADTIVRRERDRLTFLCTLASQIRDPLTVLKLLPQPPPPAAIERQLHRVERVLRDLIDATLIEGGVLELRRAPHDVRELVGDVADAFRTVSADHRLVTSLPDAPVLVRCDAARFDHVVSNLVSNAIKYSPTGGTVTITLRVEGTDAVVEVSDEGIGIAPAELERIFEPTRRRGASAEPITGVGLGLFATRAIVEAHGGHIEVESTEGRGSTFRVRLPLEPAAAVSTEPHPSSAPH